MTTFSRRNFLTGLAGAAALPVLVAPAVARADSATAEDVAAKVQAFYDATKTYQAKFTQNYYIRVQDKKQVSSGNVAFQKPGKMAFVYDEPNGNHVVSDGHTIKVYDKGNEQMYESPVEKSQYPAALAFLMGEGKLTKDFTLKLLDPATMKFEGGYVLEATPKEASPAYTKLLLYVDAATMQARRVLILDVQGNRNRFQFDDPVVNKELKKDTFDFEPPKGTKIVKP